MDFAVLANHRVKLKEREERDKFQHLAQELKKKTTIEHKGNVDTNCGWSTCNNPQSIGKGTGRLRNKRINGDHPDYSIIKIDQNTERSPENLGIFAVTQTSVEDQLTTVCKTLKRIIIVIIIKRITARELLQRLQLLS